MPAFHKISNKPVCWIIFSAYVRVSFPAAIGSVIADILPRGDVSENHSSSWIHLLSLGQQACILILEMISGTRLKLEVGKNATF